MGSFPPCEFTGRGAACTDCARSVGKQLDLELKGAMRGIPGGMDCCALCICTLGSGRCDTCRAYGRKTSLSTSSEKEGGTGCLSDLMADLPHDHLNRFAELHRAGSKPGTLRNWNIP